MSPEEIASWRGVIEDHGGERGPCPIHRMAWCSDRVQAWGELRRAGEIADPGTESVRRMLAEQDQAAQGPRAE
jgi:hypothetical protein